MDDTVRGDFQETLYGKLPMRVRAILVDILVYAGLGLTASQVMDKFEFVADPVRGLVFVFVFLLYDPLCTAFLGGTVGHLIVGLKVRKESNMEENIPLHLAFVRFICKSLLGWFSLITVGQDKKMRALHDNVAGSVVIVE